MNRYDRERDFHNRSFTAKQRVVTAKYYSVAEEAKQYYGAVLGAFPLGSAVLEYGCGPGSRAFELADRGCKVVGIDISDVAMAQARTEAEARGLHNVQFIRMNAERLEFDNAMFDHVCGSGILHHLDLKAAAAELTRVMKPSGSAVFLEPLGHNSLLNLYRKLTPRLRTPDEHPLRREDCQLLRDHFEHVDVKFFCLTTLVMAPFMRVPGAEILLRLLQWVDRQVFRMSAGTRLWAWICVITLEGPKKTLSVQE